MGGVIQGELVAHLGHSRVFLAVSRHRYHNHYYVSDAIDWDSLCNVDGFSSFLVPATISFRYSLCYSLGIVVIVSLALLSSRVPPSVLEVPKDRHRTNPRPRLLMKLYAAGPALAKLSFRFSLCTRYYKPNHYMEANEEDEDMRYMWYGIELLSTQIRSLQSSILSSSNFYRRRSRMSRSVSLAETRPSGRGV